MLEITKGTRPRPVRVVIYGAEGVGKSTFASNADGAVFIDLENGTDQMDVARFPKPSSWDELLNMLSEISANPGICKTVILDTADRAELLCTDYICSKYKKSGVEEFGYGKGYTYLSEEYSRLLNALDQVVAAGINVIVIAHAKMRKFEQPDEMGAYDRWEMKLSKQVAPLLKEWCDALFFINFKTFVVTSENNTKKAQGGKRVMYATHHPCWDAKNRHDLPDEMDLNFSLISRIFAGTSITQTATKSASAPADENLQKKLHQMLLSSGISEQQLQNLVVSKGHYGADVSVDKYPDSFISRWIIPNWNKIISAINQNKEATL